MQEPYFPPAGSAAASRLSSRMGWGCFKLQFQKRGISNRPGEPEFCQHGPNSSRSDLRLLRSSDRPPGTAKFRFPGTVRNIRRFFLWSLKHPHPIREERWLAAADPAGGKYGSCTDAFILVKLHDIVIVTEHENSIFKKVKASGLYFYKIHDRGPYYLRSADK